MFKKETTHGIYILKDKVTGKNGMPFISINNESAQREVKEILQKVRYTKDFILEKVGEYNENNTEIKNTVTREIKLPIEKWKEDEVNEKLRNNKIINDLINEVQKLKEKIGE